MSASSLASSDDTNRPPSDRASQSGPEERSLLLTRPDSASGRASLHASPSAVVFDDRTTVSAEASVSARGRESLSTASTVRSEAPVVASGTSPPLRNVESRFVYRLPPMTGQSSPRTDSRSSATVAPQLPPGLPRTISRADGSAASQRLPPSAAAWPPVPDASVGPASAATDSAAVRAATSGPASGPVGSGIRRRRSAADGAGEVSVQLDRWADSAAGVGAAAGPRTSGPLAGATKSAAGSGAQPRPAADGADGRSDGGSHTGSSHGSGSGSEYSTDTDGSNSAPDDELPDVAALGDLDLETVDAILRARKRTMQRVTGEEHLTFAEYWNWRRVCVVLLSLLFGAGSVAAAFVVLLMMEPTPFPLPPPDFTSRSLPVHSLVGVPSSTYVALSPNGSSVVVVYADQAAVRLFICGDAQCSDNSTMVTRNISLLSGANHVTVGFTPDGRPLIGYVLTINSRVVLAVCNDSWCGRITSLTALALPAGSGPLQVGTRINGSLPMILYQTANNQALYVTSCSSPACLLKTDYTVINRLSPQPNSFGASMALYSGRQFIVAYYDGSAATPGLYLHHAFLPGGSAVVLIDPSVGAGEDGTYVLTGGESYPHIFYRAAGNVLMCASCLNYNCTESRRRLVASDGGLSITASYGIDSLPTVVHYVPALGRFVVHHCGRSSCAKPQLTTTYMPVSYTQAGASFMYPTLENQAIVTYNNATGTLYLVTCANAQCAGIYQNAQDFGRRAAIGLRRNPYEAVMATSTRSVEGVLMLQRGLQPDFRAYEQTAHVDGAVDSSVALLMRANGTALFLYSTTLGVRAVACYTLPCLDDPAHRSRPFLIDVDVQHGSFLNAVLLPDERLLLAYRCKAAQSVVVSLSTGTFVPGVRFTTFTVDNSSWVGSHLAATLDPAGLPALVYHDDRYGDLRIARCLRTDCALVVTGTVQSAGNVGKFAAICFNSSAGAAAYPWIVHYNDSSGALLFLQCFNALCSHHTATELSSVRTGAGRDSGVGVHLRYDRNGDVVRLYFSAPHHAGNSSDLYLISSLPGQAVPSQSQLRFIATIPMPDPYLTLLSLPANASQAFGGATHILAAQGDASSWMAGGARVLLLAEPDPQQINSSALAPVSQQYVFPLTPITAERKQAQAYSAPGGDSVSIFQGSRSSSGGSGSGSGVGGADDGGGVYLRECRSATQTCHTFQVSSSPNAVAAFVVKDATGATFGSYYDPELRGTLTARCTGNTAASCDVTPAAMAHTAAMETAGAAWQVNALFRYFNTSALYV